MDKKQIAIIGGGTISWIGSHLALSAPAYGATARQLERLCFNLIPEMDPVCYMTKMAGGIAFEGESLETNEDIAKLVDRLTHDDVTKIVFFTAAMVDFNGEIGGAHESGKYGTRLKSDSCVNLLMVPAEKVISKVRETRKDIFLVGFKQTFGATEDEQYIAGLKLCKDASCNLVLANDTKTRLNMVITPEEARYHVTEDRTAALAGLVKMAKLRSHLTFTRSTVVSGEPISWDSDLVPSSLRAVVDHCINCGAYKPFQGSTVGHFAVKVDDRTFLTSQRRTNFNDLKEIGLVKIETDGPDSVVAYGSKPSVGGQSQRIVFEEHGDVDCIVHFHCPIKEGSEVPVVSQYEFECGSHECGQNTSSGLKRFGNLSAVYLDEHGPNIVFNRSIDPQEVIDFIDNNFDLSQKTGGFVSIKQRLDTPSTVEDLAALSDGARRAKGRPDNYEDLPARDQWEIDKQLGILDWDGK